MFLSSTRTGALRIGVLMVTAFALGASASAGTLYSWKTDDGTFAYTNDKKRIPARYKGQVETSTLKTMNSYQRFTPGPEMDLAPYSERVVERLEVLRDEGRMPASSGGEIAAGQTPFVRVNVEAGGRHRGGGAQVEIPVGASADPDMEPVVIETVRMKPGKGHNATRHFRVVRQGEKVLAVIRGENTDNGLESSLRESDFGGDSLD